jgi:P4 family phage/plasmid primase-like protien
MNTTYVVNAEEKTAAKKGDFYLKVAAGFVDDVPVIYHKGRFFVWEGKAYRAEGEIGTALVRWLIARKIGFNNETISNVLTVVRGLRSYRGDMPSWTSGGGPGFVINFDNGMLDVERFIEGDSTLLPHSRNWFSTCLVPYRFNPRARCPNWHAFLGQVFEGDGERVRLLQEYMGYCLTPNASLQKMLVLVGLSRAGKGVIRSVVEEMVGKDKAVGYNLRRLLSNFGLYPLLSAQVALVGEVELTRGEHVAVLEMLKSITGQDPQTIEIKHDANLFSAVLPTKFIISCNSMPNFKDPSGALANRMLLLNFNKSFAGQEDTALFERKLKPEVEGICQWSVEGLKRVRTEGWTIPGTMSAAVNQFSRENNTALAFLQDCCRVHPDYATPVLVGVEVSPGVTEVEKKTVQEVFYQWARDNNPDASWPWACRDMRKMMPKLPERARRRVGQGLVDFVPGIDVKPEVLFQAFPARKGVGQQ